MKKFIFVILLLAQVSSIFAQTSGNLYEVEILLSKGTGKRDTREVNAVVVFEKEKVKIKSRRGSEVFKEFNYSEISEVQHTFARSPKFKLSGKDVALTLLTGFPAFLFSQAKALSACGYSLILPSEFSWMKEPSAVSIIIQNVPF